MANPGPNATPLGRGEHDDALRSMRAQGMNTVQIGNVLGCRPRAVSSRLERLGLTVARKRNRGGGEVAAWDMADARRLRSTGMSYAAIGQRFGMTMHEVRYQFTMFVEPRLRKQRACMTCQAPFPSEGAHNRMCSNCRLLSDGSPDAAIRGVRLSA